MEPCLVRILHSADYFNFWILLRTIQGITVQELQERKNSNENKNTKFLIQLVQKRQEFENIFTCSVYHNPDN